MKRLIKNITALVLLASLAFPGAAFGASPAHEMNRRDFVEKLLQEEHFDPDQYEIRTGKRFVDVLPDSVDAQYIYYLLDTGAIQVPFDKKFNPERAIRNLDALRLIFFIKGIPAPKIFPKEQFSITNLSPKAAYAPVVARALSLGILPGGKYYPFAPLTEKEAGRLLNAAQTAAAGNNLTVIQITGPGAGTLADINNNGKFALLENAWERVKENYLHRDTVKDDDLVYAATEGLVKELGDPYSEFNRPEKNTLSESLSGEVEGIGAVIEANEVKQIVILSPLKGSPAEKAGLLPEDIILEVDGTPITGISVNEAAAKIRGQAGTTVKLKIQRGTQTLDFTITRAKLTVPSVTLSLTSDNIAVLTISSFSQTTAGEFLKALAAIANAKPRGIIMDLRNNPGGYLDTAVFIAGYFIESGKTVVKVKYPDHTEIQESVGTGVLSKYPVRILVNKGSASASEILAGSLQDYGIAKLIGEKTYGKGTVQEFTTYGDGSSLKITVAEWLTPKDRTIDKNGIIPDTVVVQTADDIRAGRDLQMDQALTELRQ